MSDLELDDDAPHAQLAEHLRDLVRSPGWKWLLGVAVEEFGPAGYGRKVNTAITEIGAGPNREFEVAHAVERIHESCDAVNTLMKRPAEELAKLIKKPATRPFERFRRA